MWDRLEQREIARRKLRPGPQDRPRPDLPAGTDLIPRIKHIVVLMMENHSYDNYLGMMKGRGDGLPLGADGAPDVVNKVPDGRQFTARHLTSTAQLPGNPTQSWRASHIAYNDGSCDGFSASIVETVPGRLAGAPVLKNTRLPVDAILNNYDDGLEPEQIAEIFEVPVADVRTILEYREDQLARSA